jgi:alkylhydroperoxidase family enzyme
MAYIETIPPESATGLLARIYEAAIRRAGRVFNILRVQSLGPHALQSSMALYQSTTLADSPLSRSQREMIAVVVSRENGCHY